jgi:hypothetical protein
LHFVQHLLGFPLAGKATQTNPNRQAVAIGGCLGEENLVTFVPVDLRLRLGRFDIRKRSQTDGKWQIGWLAFTCSGTDGSGVGG